MGLVNLDKSTKKQKNDLGKTTKHFQNHFTDPETE